MKITKIQSETHVEFHELKNFEAFLRHGVAYLKIPVVYDHDGCELNCICFDSERVTKFNDTFSITPVKSELILKTNSDIKDLMIDKEDDGDEKPWDLN